MIVNLNIQKVFFYTVNNQNLKYDITEKDLYDNPGNVPNKGTNFNTQKFWKMYLFVICMISRHWFQTKLLLYIA